MRVDCQGDLLPKGLTAKGACCLGDIRVLDDTQPWVLTAKGACCLGDIRVSDDSQPWVLTDIRDGFPHSHEC